MNYDVCVVGGLGHVGLPLGLAFADHGPKVALYDINPSARDKVQSGNMPFLEIGGEEVLNRVLNKNLLYSQKLM